jgi:hypothetical protein
MDTDESETAHNQRATLICENKQATASSEGLTSEVYSNLLNDNAAVVCHCSRPRALHK